MLISAAIFRRAILPGNRIRVLVVDDSVVIRRLVTHALEEDPATRGGGVPPRTASIALQRIPQLNPDVITLDIEMPEMDGLAAAAAYPARLSAAAGHHVQHAHRARRGRCTLEALTLGADDYVTKASNEGSLDRSMARLRAELIPKIKQFFLLARARSDRARGVRLAPAVDRRDPAASAHARQPKVLAIGVSTGGPPRWAPSCRILPADFPLPVLIVQHMPPLFTRLLAERLQTATSLARRGGGRGRPGSPGKILIAPGDFHMQVRPQRRRDTRQHWISRRRRIPAVRRWTCLFRSVGRSVWRRGRLP